MVIMMIILMVMMMTNTYLLSNIYTELGTFLSSSTVEIFPDIYLKNTIKAGGSTARAQNVDWVSGVEWIPLRLLRLLEH